MIIMVNIFYVLNTDCVLRVGLYFFLFFFIFLKCYHIHFNLPWKMIICPLVGSEVTTTTRAVAGTDYSLLIRA